MRSFQNRLQQPLRPRRAELPGRLCSRLWFSSLLIPRPCRPIKNTGKNSQSCHTEAFVPLPLSPGNRAYRPNPTLRQHMLLRAEVGTATSAVLNRSVQEIRAKGSLSALRRPGRRCRNPETLNGAPLPEELQPSRNVAHLRAVQDAIRSKPFYETKPQRTSRGYSFLTAKPQPPILTHELIEVQLPAATGRRRVAFWSSLRASLHWRRIALLAPARSAARSQCRQGPPG